MPSPPSLHAASFAPPPTPRQMGALRRLRNTDARLSGDAEYDAFTALGRRRAASLSAFLASQREPLAADETGEVRAALIAQWKRENAVLEGAFQEAQRIHLARGPVERVTAIANLVPEDQLPRLLADAMTEELERKAVDELGAASAPVVRGEALAALTDPDSERQKEEISLLREEAQRLASARRAALPTDARALEDAYAILRESPTASAWLGTPEGLAQAREMIGSLRNLAATREDARTAFAAWIRELATSPPETFAAEAPAPSE